MAGVFCLINQGEKMKRIFEKVKGKLVRLDKETVGVVCGYTEDHFIILLEEGINPIYAFSLDELGAKNYYIDATYETDCEGCWYAYADEKNLNAK